jgi:putative N6-adenine-specific DNA methylase
MCGSGTLAIEAALIALNRAPGLLRDNFGFMHLLGFEETGYRVIREKARRVSKKFSRGRIITSDISPDAVDAARRNAATAGVEEILEFAICDFSQTPVPAEEGGVIVFNPEYGERLGERKKLEGVYEAIGDFFKKKCQGYRGYIFTGNLDLAKKVGLRTRRRTPFFNSNIECRLLEYELYAGSRRQRNSTPSPLTE